jgi:hypothetical protein
MSAARGVRLTAGAHAGANPVTCGTTAAPRLPPLGGGGFLPPVRQNSVPPAATPAASSVVRRAAVLAAAAAIGLLAGFGVREGSPLLVLGGAGLRLRGLPEFVTPDRGVGVFTLLGALHAGLVAYGWGLLAASLGRRLAAWPAAGALVLLGATIAAVDPLLPTILRLAAGAPSTGQRVLCALVLVAAAGLGTRLVPRRVVARGRAWAVDRTPEALPAADAVTRELPVAEGPTVEQPTVEVPLPESSTAELPVSDVSDAPEDRDADAPRARAERPTE